jgi:hypothetical protein
VAEDYTLAVLLTIGAAALLIAAILRGRPGAAVYGSSFLVAVTGFALAMTNTPELPMILYNAYVLLLGIFTLAVGLRSGRLSVVNGGMFLLVALILMRFFDSDVGFAARGVAFIVLGLGFIGTNIALWRRGARHTGEVA